MNRQPSLEKQEYSNMLSTPAKCFARPVQKIQQTSGSRQAQKSLPPTASSRLNLEPSDQRLLLRQRVLAEAHRNHYDDAIAVLNYLIARFPHSAVDYNNRGLMYQRLGELDQAIQDYDTALHEDPDLDSAYNNRGNCYATQGLKQLAIADYDRAIDLNPYNLKARINLGMTLRDLGHYADAIANFDLALQICRQPHLAAHIYAERGRTHQLNGDWNCAIADYQQSLVQLHKPAIAPVEALGTVQPLAQRVTTWLHQLHQAATAS